MINYTPDNYNQYGVLKLPSFLILATFYLLKHYFIIAFPIMAHIPMIGMVIQPLIQVMPSAQYSSGALLYSCIPALLVFISMAMRKPTASAWLGWIWKKSKWLLLSSIVLEIALFSLYIVLGIKKLNEVILMFIYIDVVLIIYLMRSQRIRDAIAQFPEKGDVQE
jgi:hypothetical protein